MTHSFRHYYSRVIDTNKFKFSESMIGGSRLLAEEEAHYGATQEEEEEEAAAAAAAATERQMRCRGMSR